MAPIPGDPPNSGSCYGKTWITPSRSGHQANLPRGFFLSRMVTSITLALVVPSRNRPLLFGILSSETNASRRYENGNSQ